jgi:N-methylhydantoinase A
MKGSGFPLRIPAIELVEIGSGGGSIAALDALGRLLVGPRSAASVPGPVCYGRGGAHPTVTDADVVLGKIDPSRFSSDMILDVNGARMAIDATIGAGLGLDPDLAAFAITEIVSENMASAARVHAIESGKDLGVRTMIAFGGAAPLHAARVAKKLGVSRVMIPANAGVGSAIGFLDAGLAFEQARSLYMTLGAFEPDRVNDLLAEMSEAARKLLGGAASDLTETRAAYMRYRGQGHEITVPAPTDQLNAGTAQALAAGFDARYTLLFGQTIPDLEVEILTWTVRVERKGHQAGGGRNARSASEMQGSPRTISVFDAAQSRRLDYAVLARETLSAGFGISGPCLVTESHTTTVVSSDFDLEVAADGALLLTSKPAMEGISQ